MCKGLYKKITLMTLMVFSTSINAQIGGDHAYSFLALPSAPRQAALGGTNITNYDADVTTAFQNPATINAEMNNALAINFGKMYGDVSYGTAAFSKNFRENRNFHIGVTYLHYGTLEGYDELGQKTQDFSGSDVALSVGYSYHLDNTPFYFGTNIKLISSQLETYHSLGAAADIAGMYVNPDTGWNVAFAFRNIGMQITTYNDLQEKMPFEMVLGFSKKLENVPIRWHLTLEQLQKWNVSFANPNRSQTNLDGEIIEENVSFVNNVLRHVILGLEFFPEKKFNLRLAYNFRKGEEMKILEQRHFSGLSAGFGFAYKNLRFDYTYMRYTTAANTSFFGVAIKL